MKKNDKAKWPKTTEELVDNDEFHVMFDASPDGVLVANVVRVTLFTDGDKVNMREDPKGKFLVHRDYLPKQ